MNENQTMYAGYPGLPISETLINWMPRGCKMQRQPGIREQTPEAVNVERAEKKQRKTNSKITSLVSKKGKNDVSMTSDITQVAELPGKGECPYNECSYTGDGNSSRGLLKEDSSSEKEEYEVAHYDKLIQGLTEKTEKLKRQIKQLKQQQQQLNQDQGQKKLKLLQQQEHQQKQHQQLQKQLQQHPQQQQQQQPQKQKKNEQQQQPQQLQQQPQQQQQQLQQQPQQLQQQPQQLQQQPQHPQQQQHQQQLQQQPQQQQQQQQHQQQQQQQQQQRQQQHQQQQQQRKQQTKSQQNIQKQQQQDLQQQKQQNQQQSQKRKQHKQNIHQQQLQQRKEQAKLQQQQQNQYEPQRQLYPPTNNKKVPARDYHQLLDSSGIPIKRKRSVCRMSQESLSALLKLHFNVDWSKKTPSLTKHSEIEGCIELYGDLIFTDTMLLHDVAEMDSDMLHRMDKVIQNQNEQTKPDNFYANDFELILNSIN